MGRRLAGAGWAVALVAALAFSAIAPFPPPAADDHETVRAAGPVTDGRVLAPSAASAAASSTAPNRAAVVVDLGDGEPIRTVCVHFDEDSITGKELLERADLDAVFSTYSGEGSAVCALSGKGCPGDGSCLTCKQPDYWAYHRAPAGA